MSFKKNVLEIINVTLNKGKKEDSFLISNLNFSLMDSKTHTVYFKNSVEKRAFISLFTNDNISYSGLIKINGKIHNPLNSSLSDSFSFHDLNIFNNANPKTRVIEIIEKEVLKNQYDIITKIIETNNKYDKNIKMLKISGYKRIELSYYRALNILIKKAINHIEKLTNQLKSSQRNVDELIIIYDDFILSHVKYLKNRINLLIDRNIMLIELYKKKFTEKIDEKRNISIQKKAKQLIEKTNIFETYDKSLEKIKKQTSSFVFDEKSENIKKNIARVFAKNVFDSIIFEFEYKYKYYSNEIKKIENKKKTAIDFLNLFSKKILTFEFLKIFKKNMIGLSSLSKENIELFYREFERKYLEYVMFLEKENIFNNEEIKNVRKLKRMIINYVKKDVKKELKLIMNKYNNLLNQSTNQDNTGTHNTTYQKGYIDKNDRNEIKSNIESIKIEYQDLWDEIDWENKLAFYQMNDNLNVINQSIEDEKKIYENRKKFYNKLIFDFIDFKNAISQNIYFETSSKQRKFKDHNFFNEASKFETIYKFVANDSKILENLFFKNKTKISRYTQDNEIIVISRYSIFKSSKNIDISIFDYLKRSGKIDNILKNVFFLIIGLLDGKKITIYENLFSNLNYNDSLEFLKIYNILTMNSNKKWILIESNILHAKDAADEISIIDKSKQIEFGKTANIFENPIYDVSLEAFGLKPTGFRPTPDSFNKFIDYHYGYDYYEINDKHVIYGNVNQIYDWSKVIPNKTEMTISTEELNNLKNKISFDEISNTKQRDYSIANESNDNSTIFNSREFLIIDVE